MKTWHKALIIILAVVFLIALVSFIFSYLNSDTYKEKQAIKNTHLSKYSYSTGGDMLGSYYSTEIELKDNDAIMTVTERETHAADSIVKKYKIDKKALSEIEKIFKDANMQSWAHNKISDIFVADGASYSYSFYFGDTDISFSSQSYTPSFQKHLGKIDDVIKKYGENKEEISSEIIKNEG